VMGRRIAAYLIDAVIALAVAASVFWSVSETVENTPLISCGDDNAPTLCLELGDTIRFAESGDANLVTGSGLLVWAVFGIVIQGVTGGTPGKLMVGLRGCPDRAADAGAATAPAARRPAIVGSATQRLHLVRCGPGPVDDPRHRLGPVASHVTPATTGPMRVGGPTAQP